MLQLILTTIVYKIRVSTTVPCKNYKEVIYTMNEIRKNIYKKQSNSFKRRERQNDSYKEYLPII